MSMTESDPAHDAHFADVILLGPDGHGREELLRELRQNFPSEGLLRRDVEKTHAPAYGTLTEISLTSMVLRLWDCPQEHWYRMVLYGGPRQAAALLVFSPEAAICQATGAEMEEELELLRELGPTPLVVLLNSENPNLGRAERALRDLVEPEDPRPGEEDLPVLTRLMPLSRLLDELVERRLPPVPRVSNMAQSSHVGREVFALVVAVRREIPLVLTKEQSLLASLGTDHLVPCLVEDVSPLGEHPYGRPVNVHLRLSIPVPLVHRQRLAILDPRGERIAEGCILLS